MNSNNINKRVVIFFWDGWLSVSPSMINTILLLHKNGYEVDCITRFLDYQIAEDIDFPTGVTIHRYGTQLKPATQTNNKNEIFTAARKNSIGHTIKKTLGIKDIRSNFKRNIEILSLFYNYILFSKKIISDKKYSFVIGVDTKGLVSAGILFFFKKITLVYFSLEIRFVTDFKFFIDRKIKQIEKYFHKKANFTIIQDKYRLTCLNKENGIAENPNNFVIVPNGPMGKFENIQSNYFKELFQFSDEDVIVLHAGGLSTGIMNDEIAKCCTTWPDNFKLVFHFSVYFDEDSEAIERLKALSNNKAFFSILPVPFDQLATITSSAHVGIAFYSKKRGLNHSLIVGASGKMASYFNCGLPVIALDLKGFKELFDEYNCGVVIKSPEDCGEAIKTIMNDYKTFSKNAVRCYEEVYEFELHFKKVLDKIDAIKN